MSQGKLRRQLGLFDGTAVVMGIVIGSGIFMTPALMARSIPSPGLLMCLWIVTGLASMCGALAFAELGAMLPETGGQYVFLREAYGETVAFLFGWSSFLVVWSGGTAAISIGFGVYLGRFVSLTPWQVQGVAIGLITAFTALNVYGVRSSARVQDTLNLLRLVGIFVLIFGAFKSAPASGATLFPATHAVSITAVGSALMACLFSYEGWPGVSFLAGELKDPQKTLPRALVMGLGAIILIYVLLTGAYFRVLPFDVLSKSEQVATDVAQHLFGDWGSALIAVTILVSIAGSTNGCLLAPARIYHAQAVNGELHRMFAHVHPRYGTPDRVLIIQWMWCVLLCFTGTYEALLSYSTIMSWLGHGLTVAAVIVLRKKLGHLDRPFKLPAYPWTAIVFVMIACVFVVVSCVSYPVPSMWGAVILLAGIPAQKWLRQSS